MSAGGALAGVGVAMGAAMLPGLMIYATYEQALADLRAAANPTAEQFERIKASIESVATATGVDPAQVAAAYSELLKAGKTVEEVLGGLGNTVVRFARVSGIEMGVAAVVLSDALNVFSRDGLTASDAANLINQSADASTVSLLQVSEAMSTGGSVMAMYGQSMRDTAIAIAILGDAGVKGAEAGTSLRRIMLNIGTGATSTDAAGLAFRELGLNVRDARGEMLPMVSIIGNLQTALAGKSAADQARLIGDLAGTFGVTGLNALLAGGVARWEVYSARMDTALTVEQKFAIMTNTLLGNLKRLWVAVQLVAIEVGTAMAPAFSVIGTILVPLMTGVRDFVRANQWLFMVLISTAAGLVTTGVAIAAFGAAIWAIGSVVGVLASIAGGIGLAIGAFTALAGYFTISAIFSTLYAAAILLVPGLSSVFLAVQGLIAVMGFGRIVIAWFNGVMIASASQSYLVAFAYQILAVGAVVLNAAVWALRLTWSALTVTVAAGTIASWAFAAVMGTIAGVVAIANAAAWLATATWGLLSLALWGTAGASTALTGVSWLMSAAMVAYQVVAGSATAASALFTGAMVLVAGAAGASGLASWAMTSAITAGSAVMALGSAAAFAYAGFVEFLAVAIMAASWAEGFLIAAFWAMVAATWAASSATAISNGIIAAGAAIWGFFTGSTVAATGASWLYSLAAWASAIATAIWTGGLNLLVGALALVVVGIVAVVLAAGGIILVGAAIAGVALAIQSFGIRFGEMSEYLGFLDGMVDGIVETATEIWNWIVDSPLGEFVGSAVSMLNSLWDTISGAFGALMDFLDDSGISTFIGYVVQAYLGVATLIAVVIGFAGYGAYLLAKWLIFGDGFATIWNTIVGFFSGGDGTLLPAFFEGLAEGWANVMSVFKTAFGFFKDVFAAIYSPLIAIGQATQNVASQALVAASSMVGTLTGAASRIMGAFSGAFASLTAGFGTMFSGIVSAGTQAWGGLVAAFSIGDWTTMWAIIQATAMLAWQHISFFGTEQFYTWKDVLLGTFDTIWTALRVVFETGWGFIQTGFYTVMIAILRQWDAIAEAIAAAADNINPLMTAAEAARAAESRRTTANMRITELQRNQRVATETAAQNVRELGYEAIFADAARETAETARAEAAAAGNMFEVMTIEALLAAIIDSAEQAAFDNEMLDVLGGLGGGAPGRAPPVVGDRTDTLKAKTEVLGGFSAQAIMGFMAGRTESPAARQERLMQEQAARLDRQIALLQELIRVVVPRFT